MTLKLNPKYPVRRAYVVKLTRDATPDALCGRIENLVSGQHSDFTSAPELLRLIAGDMSAGGTGSPIEP